MSDNIVLGRGKLYFDRFAQNTDVSLGGERYLGNTPSFALTVETQELDHYSAEEGLRKKDLSVTMQIDMGGTFVTDNIDLDNIAMFFFGQKSVESVSAITGQTDTFASIIPGTFLQLGKSTANPVGLRSVSNVTVEDNGGGGTTYVAGTDYRVDEALGRVEILAGGGIAAGATLDITFDVAEHNHDLVVSGSDIIYGALRFIAFNGVGRQTDFYMPKVALRPNGEYALKGDDWQQFGFNLEVLQLGDLQQVYADGRPYSPT